MVDPITLLPEQVKSLRLQARRSVGRVSERIHYVLLFARGYSVKEIAALYQVDNLTVASWLKRYREAGVGGLDDLPRSGRPHGANGAARAEAVQCLDGTPETAGVARTTWTRRLLQRHLGERLGCFLSRASMTRLIGALGFVWTRPKLTVKEGDPEGAQRTAAMAAALAAHPEVPRL